MVRARLSDGGHRKWKYHPTRMVQITGQGLRRPLQLSNKPGRDLSRAVSRRFRLREEQGHSPGRIRSAAARAVGGLPDNGADILPDAPQELSRAGSDEIALQHPSTHSPPLHRSMLKGLNRLLWRRFGAPGEIRTPNPQIRSLVLYPVELRAQWPVVVRRLIFRRRTVHNAGCDGKDSRPGAKICRIDQSIPARRPCSAAICCLGCVKTQRPVLGRRAFRWEG